MAWKKKNLTLFVLLSVFLVLCIAYFAILHYKDNQQAKTDKEELLFVYELDSIQEISYYNGTKQLDFVKKDGTWYSKNDESFALSQSYLTRIEGLYTKLKADRKLEGAGALAEYGLETPAASVTVTSGTGEQITVQIGNQTGDHYYCIQKGGQEVYTVSAEVMSSISYGLEDMEETTAVEMETQSQ